MVKEIFIIADVTNIQKVKVGNTNIYAKVSDWKLPEFDSYEAAKNHIKELPSGYYQISKVFVKTEQ